MTYLVTGGCGFIGSNYINYLLENYNINIINVDKLTYASNPKNVNISKKYGDRYKFYKIDISDWDRMNFLFSKNDIDYIINFAAESHVDNSIKLLNQNSFVQSNIKGTLTLLQLGYQYGINKFLQISTDEVYGSINEGQFKEETNLQARNPYSATKASADLLALSFFHTFNFPVCITRCSNNYGMYQYPEKLIPLVILNAIKNENIGIYGDGLNIRDWIFVEDHIRAIQLVLEKGLIGEVYNIGGDTNNVTNLDIVKYILKSLNKPKSLIKFIDDRLGHDKRYSMNFDRIKNELGFSLMYDLDKGLDKTIKWYTSNTNHWSEQK